MFKTIIVALDGSQGASKAGAIAGELAESEGAKLVVVHVAEHTIGKGGGDLNADEDQVKQEVRAQADAFAGKGVEVSVEIRDEMAGGPAHTIAGLANEIGADLIIAGTRGHSSIAGLLLGSVTHRLLHISKCPVLTVPSG